MKASIFALILLIPLIVSVGIISALSVSEAADTVYKNGKIYTVDENHPWVEAIAIQGDRFVFVGTNDGAESWIGPDTKVVDLDGKFVAPGFYDMHTHPDIHLEPKYTGGISTPPLGPEELKKAILEFDKENPGDGWIFGGTWAPHLFAEAGVTANSEYLDSFISDRPVAMLSITRHNMLVNSIGMELGGIDRDTYEPEHAIIVKDDDGNPTGMLSDGAQSLLSHVLPQANIMQLKEIYRESQGTFNEYGFVAIRSLHVNSDRLKAVQLLEREDALTVRIDLAISWKNDLHVTVPDRAALISGELHRYNSQHVDANQVKWHFDATPLAKSAFFLEPYRGSTDYYGRLNATPEEMNTLMVQLDRQNIKANIHVLGDGATRLALDAIEHAREVNGPNGPRHMLAHTTWLHNDDVDRIAELNVAAEFTHYLMDPEKAEFIAYNEDKIVPEEARPRMLNIKRVLDSGGIAVFGSDLVATPTPNIFPNLVKILDRGDPERTITVEQALTMLTINGAWAMDRENEAGSITEGKYADFIVLDRNWFEIPTSDVADTKVLKTVFEGNVVYSLGDS